MLGGFINGISLQRLGCNAELIVDEFGEKLLEELDYLQVDVVCLCAVVYCTVWCVVVVLVCCWWYVVV